MKLHHNYGQPPKLDRNSISTTALLPIRGISLKPSALLSTPKSVPLTLVKIKSLGFTIATLTLAITNRMNQSSVQIKCTTAMEALMWQLQDGT